MNYWLVKFAPFRYSWQDEGVNLKIEGVNEGVNLRIEGVNEGVLYELQNFFNTIFNVDCKTCFVEINFPR